MLIFSNNKNNMITKIIKIILGLFAVCIIVGTIVLAMNPSKSIKTEEPKVETPKQEESVDVKVTQDQLDSAKEDYRAVVKKQPLPKADTSIDTYGLDEAVIIKTFKDGFIEGCVKDGTDRGQCTCAYNYIYTMLGSDGLVRESLYYVKYDKMSELMLTTIYQAALACI